MLAQLGHWVTRRRFAVLAAWAALFLAGGIFGGGVFDRAELADNLRPGAESTLARNRLAQVDPEGSTVVAVISGRDFFTVSLVDSASKVMYEIRAIKGVAEVTDAYTSGSGQVGRDNQSSLVVVELRPGLSKDAALAVAQQVKDALHRIDAPQVLVGGELLAEHTFGEQAIKDAAGGESVAFAVLGVVMIVLLGGFVVGSLPIATALATVAATLLALFGLTGLIPVNEYAVNVVTLLGLGLAVDYCLLVLTRFREDRAADPGAAIPDLIARCLATSGRAVLISGLAVGAALTGLFAFADPLLAAMAFGGAVVVCLATLAGLTLVPALIAVAHRRIPAPGVRLLPRARRPGSPAAARNSGARRAGSVTATSARISRPARATTAAVPNGLLAKLAAFSQRRPALVAVTVAIGLLVLSIPLWSVKLGNSDVRSLPASSEERRAYELITRDFADGAKLPVTVLIEANRAHPAVQPMLDRMDQLPGVEEVDIRSKVAGEVTVVDLRLAKDVPEEQLVREIRRQPAEVTRLVAGPAAELVDAKNDTGRRLPLAVLIIVLATGVLLFALTGSIVVPLKALVLNLLTLIATLGILVAVFQWGWGASILGFEPWGALDLTTPLLLFVFIFGLSMDYEVFLLARIKEEWDRRTPGAKDRAANDHAVLAGITATGPVITLAAIAIGIVFLGFALGELVAVKEIGVGMTLAILIDVTVIRGLLLPAVMSLLGRHNWWPAKSFAPPAPAAQRFQPGPPTG